MLLPGTPRASPSHQCVGLQEGALGSWARGGRAQGVKGPLAPEGHRQCPTHASLGSQTEVAELC